VLYCVLKLCTVISTLRWAVLTVLWIGFCLTGPISLCVDSFMFICVYFVFFIKCTCVILLWARWSGPDGIKALFLEPYLHSVLWYCWLGHITRKKWSPIWTVVYLVRCQTLLNLPVLARPRSYAVMVGMKCCYGCCITCMKSAASWTETLCLTVPFKR